MHINKVDPIEAIPHHLTPPTSHLFQHPLAAFSFGAVKSAECLLWWAVVISLVSSLTSARVWVISGSASEREREGVEMRKGGEETSSPP